MDPRAAALALYLRQRAASFSLSADVTDLDSTADAGMALLDAAAVADAMVADDPRLRLLSEAGLFETAPGGTARVVESPEIRAAIQRPLVADPQSGVEIVAGIVATATEAGPAASPLDELSQRVRQSRAAVHLMRQQRVAPEAMINARRALLQALDDYVAALERRKLPVPPALKSELDIHRALFH